ncbi:helix-turn-helix transcriptional regulator [Gracilibacillus thailandensis]|jgi:predicted ArsR family transcriptional regulator|uniref:DeoR family transcriptional regulator n=1 Tax=Gracilibacillus thailandensis TaxID=563735 RepID=A0A6N7R6J3_9BACI|nr:metalloregulator ArsR/SmtB family transcription factor [Gracilibacillus thailandensis]MRI68786.1 DeoR family transcriptional regulator [Gracilibacillus thailandensis]
MTQLMKTTKDRILELLKKEVSLSVNELIDYLDITHMAIRKHLTTLEKDGLVSSHHEKKDIGRPIQKFFLTTKGKRLFPNNYESISVEFLKDIQAIHGKDSIEQLFENREERLTKQYADLVNQSSNLEKMRDIVHIQNEKGYMAELSQHDDDQFEIVEYNCPIFAVAKEFHIACRCETSMFKKVLGTENVERVQCKTEGNNHCRFKVEFE